MIEKMKFVSITGPKDDIDRVVDEYLTKYEIHLENALSELNTVQDLNPFIELNPYKDYLSKSESMISNLSKDQTPSKRTMEPSEAANIIGNAFSMLEDLNANKKELKDKKSHLSDLLYQIEPFRVLDYDLKKILHFKFIKFRFGRISHEYFTKFSKYVYDNVNTIFYECDSDRNYVWGVYFVPASNAVQVDAIYSSLHFERVKLPDEYEGTPEEAYQAIQNQIKEIKKKTDEISNDIKTKLNDIAGDLLLAHQVLSNFCKNFEVRKLAACTKEKENAQVFYILCGWMSDSDAKGFKVASDNDENVYCFIADSKENKEATPPTKLRNPKLIKPFEMFIKMYGLPAYNEMDPTMFVAITYSLIFGIMFGDVGQGLCLVVGGYLLYKFKKMNIAAIISLAGVFSTIFGFMYGSCFGFEELIPTLWLKPMESVMTVLVVSVAFGVSLILIAIIINIVNAIRAKNLGDLLFSSNGIAGLVFYAATVLSIVLMFTGHALPGTIILVLMLGIPLLAIFLKEPLTRIIEKKSKIIPGGKVMFFVEALVELFDVVLSYATNTISFVRVGAFALSHAGMMGVVLLLSNAESGNPNLVVLILGNILVAGLEGLIVGIQVLRLEYYEMFSRFYRGTGKEFKPFIKAGN